MGTLTYISTISQLQKHLFCFSQPSACREGESGSLSAQQSGSAVLVQSMSRSTSPHHQHKCHVHFFQTLSAEAVSLTDSVSACSRQAFDIPKLLTLSGQLLLTLSLLKGKGPKYPSSLRKLMQNTPGNRYFQPAISAFEIMSQGLKSSTAGSKTSALSMS